MLLKWKILKRMATPQYFKTNPQFFFGASSCIYTALAKLPNRKSNVLNIPDTLMMRYYVSMLRYYVSMTITRMAHP